MKSTLVLSIASLLRCGLAATPEQWRGRSVYQLLTDRFAHTDGSTDTPCNVVDRQYCGGTWRGIIDKLDYIQGMGFTAIWISPITMQMEGNTTSGTSYHAYWQTDLYSLNPRFGTADDLKALSSALHERDMYLMVDVVANHFAWDGYHDTVDFSKFTPFNSSSDFHSYCDLTQADYDNLDQAAIENCWMGGSSAVPLVDVDTTKQSVKDTFNAWIGDLVTTYGIDGLRVDTVRNVQKDFWPGFNNASGVYCVGEVNNGDPNIVLPYQDYMDGILNYPLFYPMTRAFQTTNGSMTDLENMVNLLKNTAKDSTLLGTFLENHDQVRFPYVTDDLALVKNAIGFNILADGVSIIYEGQEQHYNGFNDPYNREAMWPSGYNTSAPLYKFIATVNNLRNWAVASDSGHTTYQAWPIYTDTTTIAMRKGSDGKQIIAVFSNKGSGGDSYNQTIGSTGFTSGQSVVEVVGCAEQNADSSGNINVAMEQGAPKIFIPKSALAGSEICGN